MCRVSDQDDPAEKRVRLINFQDRSAIRLPRLIKQLRDRRTEIVKVMAPITRRATVSRGNVGVAVNSSLTQGNSDQAASGCQSSVPSIVIASPAFRNEAPAPAASVRWLSSAHTGGAHYGVNAIGAHQ